MPTDPVEIWAIQLLGAMKKGHAILEQVGQGKTLEEAQEAVEHQRVLDERAQELEQLRTRPQEYSDQQSTKKVLAESLVATGRAAETKGGTPEELEEARLERAEASSGRVLEGMENATRLNQMMENERRGKVAPLAHAVSGHGKGTDQVSRLVNGRRADQLDDEERNLRELETLKEERVEEMRRRGEILKSKTAQLNAQDLRIQKGKPDNVAQTTWDQEVVTFTKDKEALEVDKKQLVSDVNKWTTGGKAKLDQAILKAQEAVTNKPPSVDVTLPVPEGIVKDLGISPTISKQGTIGEDPNNKSGAFTTNQGMLHVVQEGFAQANNVSAYDDERARKGELSEAGRLDEKRFVSNVTGRDEEDNLGYTLGVTGHSTQSKKAGLAPDEMEERAKSIQQEEGTLNKARVILDPAYVDGKRAGWNLQTTYANDDEATKTFSNPQELRESKLAAEKEVSGLEDNLKRCGTDLKNKVAALGKAKTTLAKVENDILFYTQEVNKIPEDPLKRNLKDLKAADGQLKKRLGELGKIKDLSEEQKLELEDLNKKAAELEKLLLRNECQTQLKTLTDSLGNKQKDVVTAQENFVTATNNNTQAAEKLKKAEKVVASFPKEEKPPGSDTSTDEGTEAEGEDEGENKGGGKAGYNPATGTWDGPRPAKPSGTLQGKDEEGQSLTAHHLNPWNKIRGALNEALKGNASKLKEFLNFAEVTVPPWFWKELALEPAKRSYAFSEEINHMGAAICWAPKNVFMGPLGEKRGDDPGEELDTAFTKGGLPTIESAASVMTAQTGGIGGVSPEEYNAMTQKRIEAKYKKRLPKGKKELKDLLPDDLKNMKKEMAGVGVWEYVRSEFPVKAAKDRQQKKIDDEYRKLEAKYLEEAKKAGQTELSEQLSQKLSEEYDAFVPTVPLEILTSDDLTEAEVEELNEQLRESGAQYAEAKTAFLEICGVTSEQELTPEQLTTMEETLLQFKNPRQRLTEKVVARAKQPEGGDAKPNEARPYDPEEWELDDKGKKVRKGAVKSPPGLRAMMEKVDAAIEKKVVSKVNVLRPSAPKKGVPMPETPDPLKSDYEEAIQELETLKGEWEKELKEFENVPATEPKEGEERTVSHLSGKEQLHRYPPVTQAVATIEARILQLKSEQAKAKDA